MMYRNINDFLNDWQFEVARTIPVFSSVSKEALCEDVHADVRSLQKVMWHLVETMPEMGAAAGLFAENPLNGVEAPNSVEEIIEQYKIYAEQLGKAVHSKWTDSVLEDEIDMYGDVWTKGKALQVFILHQAHHRGQMTIMMRLLGLPVPAVYGPTKEDWIKMGLPARV